MRRRLAFVAVTLVASIGVVTVPVLTLPAAAARPVTPVVRTVPLATASGPHTMARSQQSPVPGTGILRRLETARRGTQRFSLLAVTWRQAAAGSAYDVAVRTRSHGRWTEWSALPQDEDLPNEGSGEGIGSLAASGLATAPVWVGPSDGLQVRVNVRRGMGPDGLSAVLVDPGWSPADAVVGRMPAASAEAHIPRPTIYSRKQWGADESLRRRPPVYTDTIKAAFVHHTAGTNKYSRADVPAIIRAIYAYHVKVRGWSDVGYNFFVDRFGRIWEGRYGGVAKAVLGAHTGGFNSRTVGVSVLGNFQNTAPTTAAVNGVAHVIAWKFALYGSGYGLNAIGKTTLVSAGGGTARYPAGKSVTVYRISGHRDAGTTACPGEMLYPRLPRIRQLAAERMRRESTHR